MNRSLKTTRNTLPFDSIYIRKMQMVYFVTMPAHRADAVNGHIYFFRPADADLDRTMDLAPDASGQQIIPVKQPGAQPVHSEDQLEQNGNILLLGKITL